jgi:diguanylate cyclase (GGDEF)-like protein
MALDLSPFVENIARLPSIPVFVTKIVAMTKTGDIDMQSIAELITNDPALTVKILQFANSPLYGNDHKIENLRRAIVRLGLNTTVNLALSFSLASDIGAEGNSGLHYPLFWRRALLSASAALELGRLTGERALEELFLAALLQDIGMIAIDRLYPDFYVDLGSDQIFHQRVREYEIDRMGGDHAEAGAWLCKHWGLVDRTTLAVEKSHRPTTFVKGDKDGMFLRCVAVSGVAADYMIFGETADAHNQLLIQCQRILELPASKVDDIIECMREHVPEMETLFDTPLTESPSQYALLEDANAALSEMNIKVLRSNKELQSQLKTTVSIPKLSKEERYDPTTGVYSRKFADSYLPDVFNLAERSERSISFMLFEMHNIKDIRKRLSKDEVIEFVATLAKVLEKTVRGDDLVARYSEEVFLLVLTGANDEQAGMVCQRIFTAVSDLEVDSKKGLVIIEPCIGAATHGDICKFRGYEETLDAAIAALHSAKLQRKERIVQYKK